MVFVVFLHKAFVLVEMPHRLAESVPPERVSQHLRHVNLEQNAFILITCSFFYVTVVEKPNIYVDDFSNESVPVGLLVCQIE